MSWQERGSLREHEVQWNAQLFCTVNVGKAGRVRDDSVCNERFGCQVSAARDATIEALLAVHMSVGNFNARPISALEARSPAAPNDFIHALSSFANVSTTKCIHTRHKTGILDHKGHELCRVATDTEELEIVFFNKCSEYRMRC